MVRKEERGGFKMPRLGGAEGGGRPGAVCSENKMMSMQNCIKEKGPRFPAAYLVHLRSNHCHWSLPLRLLTEYRLTAIRDLPVGVQRSLLAPASPPLPACPPATVTTHQIIIIIKRRGDFQRHRGIFQMDDPWMMIMMVSCRWVRVEKRAGAWIGNCLDLPLSCSAVRDPD